MSTWLTPKLMKGGYEGERGARDEKEQDASDKVELRSLGSTFPSYGNIWKSRRKGSLHGEEEKDERHKPGPQSAGV